MSKRGYLGLVVLTALASTAMGDLVVDPQPPQIIGGIVEAPWLGTFELTRPLEEYEYEPDSGKYKLKGGFSQMVGEFLVEIEEIEFDPDPVLILSFTATNTSSSTQTLAMSVTQAALLAGPTASKGSVTTQVIDASVPDDGATAAAPTGGSVYTALIDSSVVATLQDYDFSVVAGPGGVNGAGASFGPTATGAVTQDIGLDLAVTVTGDDISQILARFEVVPEPASLAMLIGGALALLRRRRVL